MLCNSKLSFSMDPLSLNPSRQQLNLGMEKRMKSLLKAECWWFLKKILQFYKLIGVFKYIFCSSAMLLEFLLRSVCCLKCSRHAFVGINIFSLTV